MFYSLIKDLKQKQQNVKFCHIVIVGIEMFTNYIIMLFFLLFWMFEIFITIKNEKSELQILYMDPT